MKEVVEQLGVGFLEILGVIGITAIVFHFLNKEGSLNNILAEYMQSLCG